MVIQFLQEIKPPILPRLEPVEVSMSLTSLHCPGISTFKVKIRAGNTVQVLGSNLLSLGIVKILSKQKKLLIELYISRWSNLKVLNTYI